MFRYVSQLFISISMIITAQNSYGDVYPLQTLSGNMITMENHDSMEAIELFMANFMKDMPKESNEAQEKSRILYANCTATDLGILRLIR